TRRRSSEGTSDESLASGFQYPFEGRQAACRQARDHKWTRLEAPRSAPPTTTLASRLQKNRPWLCNAPYIHDSRRRGKTVTGHPGTRWDPRRHPWKSATFHRAPGTDAHIPEPVLTQVTCTPSTGHREKTPDILQRLECQGIPRASRVWVGRGLPPEVR